MDSLDTMKIHHTGEVKYSKLDGYYVQDAMENGQVCTTHDEQLIQTQNVYTKYHWRVCVCLSVCLRVGGWCQAFIC